MRFQLLTFLHIDLHYLTVIFMLYLPFIDHHVHPITTAIVTITKTTPRMIITVMPAEIPGMITKFIQM